MELLDRVEEQRPKVSGSCDGRPFQDLRDLDDLTSCVLEVLTSDGRYFWMPIADVVSIEFRDPSTRPRPALAERHPDRPGRAGGRGLPPRPLRGHGGRGGRRIAARPGDRMEGGDGTPVRGVGQRTFLVGDDAATILEIEALTLDQPGTSA